MPRPAGMPRPGPTGNYTIDKWISDTQKRFSRAMPTYSRFLVLVDDRWRPFYTEADDGLPSQNHETQRPFHLLHCWGLCLARLFLWPDPSEFFTICKNEVHVSVKREHLANESASIVDRDLHPPVDQTQHFSTLGFWRRLRKRVERIKAGPKKRCALR